MLALAHANNCQIFLTLNVLILESEIPAVLRLLSQLAQTDIDGVIVQDLGLAYLLKHHFPNLDVHASTQLNTHNAGQIEFLKRMTVSRVNLSRELNLQEIRHLAHFCHQHDVLMEVFVHGSYCIGFSGLCYISSARNGASGNRGRCSQPCREQYETTNAGSDYPLNLKDNSAFNDLQALADAGVYSLKVEGRIKKAHYVYTVVDNWRKQIDRLCQGEALSTDTTELYTVFNRDFSNGFLQVDYGKNMYINNPRDHAVTHFSKVYQCTTTDDIQSVKRGLYDKKTDIIENVERKISAMTLNTTKAASSLKGAIEAPVLACLPDNPALDNTKGLSILISSAEDAALSVNTDVDVYYQLPMGLHAELTSLIALFEANPLLKPWFPAILIGDDFETAKLLLETVAPSILIANNSGVGFHAQRLGLNWVAGPHMNTANSYSLKCLSEEYKASGAFLSNELSSKQLKHIRRPTKMRTFYSIYHPNTLLTSRQCLFQQTAGCKKIKVNNGCLKRCNKRTSIINLKDNPYVIDKQRGSYNSLYSELNVLNLAVVNDHNDLITDVFIDLRGIQTETQISDDKPLIIKTFLQWLAQPEHTHNDTIGALISPTTNNQYSKGI